MTEPDLGREKEYELWMEICHEGYQLALRIRDGLPNGAGIFEEEEAKKLCHRLAFIMAEYSPFDPTESEIIRQHLAELREDYPNVTFQLPQLMAWANLADDGR